MNEALSTQQCTETRVYKNRYLILAIVLTGILMSVLDGYMVSIALPTITGHFNASLALSEWAITGYLVVMTGFFVVFGKVSERTGKAKLFMAGWAIFTASSLACGLAPGMAWLIAFRLIQALGASMVAGVSGAIVFQAFPPKEIGKAMGYFGATMGLGALIAPGLGGLLVDYFGWQSIFLVNVPLGILLLAAALVYLKVPETISSNFRMDWAGAATLVLSVASLMLCCSELAQNLALTLPLVACGAVFALSLIAFVLQELRSPRPLLNLAVFRNAKFSLPVASMLLFAVAFNTAVFIGPFYFQGAMGYTPSQVGLLTMAMPLGMLLAAPAGGKLYDRYHWKFAAALGVAVTAAAFLLLGYAFLSLNVWLAVAALGVLGIGYGLFTSPNSTESLGALPREQTAMASSISTTARSLGGALGVSIASILLLAGLGASGYHGAVFGAGQQLLAGTTGVIMIVVSALCIVAAALSALRNI